MVYVLGSIFIIFLLVIQYWWVALIVGALILLLSSLRKKDTEKKQMGTQSSSIDAIEEEQTIMLSTSIDEMDGHDFEHWCARLLRRNGFTDVSVTPGSNDQGIDVLAYKDGLYYGIQCKCYSHDLGNKPVQEATTGRAVYGCDIAVVMTNRYFTKGAVEAATATGVWLWDRDKLAQMVRDAKGAHEK